MAQTYSTSTSRIKDRSGFLGEYRAFRQENHNSSFITLQVLLKASDRVQVRFFTC
jgi:hypothetical protein